MRSIEESLKGKNVIVTGAGNGIAKATAKAFCEVGANVVGVDKNAEWGKRTSEELNRIGRGKFLFYECDVSMHAKLKDMVEYTAKELGSIDVLVNCAGYYPDQLPVDQVTVEDFNRLLAVNLVAYYSTCKFALPYLRTSKGSIVNIGSIISVTGVEGSVIYAAAKAGVTGLTRCLALDEARNDVRVNEVIPGHICTEMYQINIRRSVDPAAFIKHNEEMQWMGRGGTPEEIANTVLFLASDLSSFTTGASLIVSGGYELGEGVNKPICNWTTMEKK